MLCLHLAWRPGKAVSATGWQAAMERLWDDAEIRSRLWLNRRDSGLGQESVCVWHEATGQARLNDPLWGFQKLRACFAWTCLLFCLSLASNPSLSHRQLNEKSCKATNLRLKN